MEYVQGLPFLVLICLRTTIVTWFRAIFHSVLQTIVKHVYQSATVTESEKKTKQLHDEIQADLYKQHKVSYEIYLVLFGKDSASPLGFKWCVDNVLGI